MKFRFYLLSFLIFSCISVSNAYAVESNKLYMFDEAISMKPIISIWMHARNDNTL